MAIGLQYVNPLLDHWKKFRPEETKEMQEEGTLNSYVQSRSRQMAAEVSNLMQNGLQQHEAEERAKGDYFLPPELGARLAANAAAAAHRRERRGEREPKP